MKRFLIVFAFFLGACNTARTTDRLLAEVWKNDQAVRYQMMELTRAVTTEGRADLIDSLITVSETVERVDAENMVIVENVLKGGLPANLTPESYKTIWIVIDHQSLENQEKYLPLIEQMALDGRIGADEYATLFDRVAMKNERPQRFGTQSIQFGEFDNMSLCLWPVESPEKVDSLRTTVGLSPLADYLRQLTTAMGIEARFDPEMTIEELNVLRYE